MSMTLNGALPLEQSIVPDSTVVSTWNFVEIGHVFYKNNSFNNILILYMHKAKGSENYSGMELHSIIII